MTGAVVAAASPKIEVGFSAFGTINSAVGSAGQFFLAHGGGPIVPTKSGIITKAILSQGGGGTYRIAIGPISGPVGSSVFNVRSISGSISLGSGSPQTITGLNLAVAPDDFIGIWIESGTPQIGVGVGFGGVYGQGSSAFAPTVGQNISLTNQLGILWLYGSSR